MVSKPRKKTHITTPSEAVMMEAGLATSAAQGVTRPVVDTGEPSASAPTALDLRNPALYLNRELSWLEFNRRVLDEAIDVRHPLLERVKFLAIFSGNLDEFFMIRVSGLKDQIAAA